MSTFRRSAVLASTLGVVLALALASPAQASHSVTVVVTGPGDTNERTFPVTADLHHTGDRWTGKAKLALRRLGTSTTTVREVAPANQVSFPVTVDHNGTYEATVTATAYDEGLAGINGHDVTGSGSHIFRVEAPPAVPGEVKAVVDAATRTVTITWKANSEPDLIGYVLQRAHGDGAFADVGEVTKSAAPTFRDSATASAGGAYRYQVLALRAGATPETGVLSQPSAVTPESTATVPDPPAPPSATPGTTVVAGASGSATPGTTAAPSKNPGALATSGSVDLSGFKTLQSQAQARATTPRSTRPADTGFKTTLPFATTEPREEGEVVEESGEVGEVAAESPQFRELGTDDDSRRQESLAFLAAGLLATVLLMHVLWIKSEVKRAPLEPLAPQ